MENQRFHRTIFSALRDDVPEKTVLLPFTIRKGLGNHRFSENQRVVVLLRSFSVKRDHFCDFEIEETPFLDENFLEKKARKHQRLSPSSILSFTCGTDLGRFRVVG